MVYYIYKCICKHRPFALYVNTEYFAMCHGQIKLKRDYEILSDCVSLNIRPFPTG